MRNSSTGTAGSPKLCSYITDSVLGLVYVHASGLLVVLVQKAGTSVLVLFAVTVCDIHFSGARCSLNIVELSVLSVLSYERVMFSLFHDLPVLHTSAAHQSLLDDDSMDAHT